jgi:hypothetical protein
VPLQKGPIPAYGRGDRRSEDQRKLENQHLASSPKPSKNQYHWCSVFDGRECVGHIVSRGKLGVEAYDARDRSVGIFPTMPLAANALIDGGAL